MEARGVPVGPGKAAAKDTWTSSASTCRKSRPLVGFHADPPEPGDGMLAQPDRDYLWSESPPKKPALRQGSPTGTPSQGGPAAHLGQSGRRGAAEPVFVRSLAGEVRYIP
jgi:hypothetical protein